MNYENASDLELITRLKLDDQIAFDFIFRRHASDLHRYLAQKLDKSIDCEEMLIDVFVSLWLNRYNLSNDLKSHLRTICRTRLAIYACDNPSSNFSKNLKALFYETCKEKDNKEN